MMFVLTLVGIVPAAVIHYFSAPVGQAGEFSGAAAFLLGFAVGAAPREIGDRTDPYSAYPAQFRTELSEHSTQESLKLLGLDCLPRLIAGHRLPDLQADPDPTALGGPGPTRGPRDRSPVALGTTVLALVLFPGGGPRRSAIPRRRRGTRPRRRFAGVLIISALATFARPSWSI